jgi:transposase
MTNFIEGACRSQATLFPERLEDYVSEENSARVIDVFIDELDLTALGFKTQKSSDDLPITLQRF